MDAVHQSQPGAEATVWERLFGVDYRALAAFRIAVGAILLADACQRWQGLRLLLADPGLFPLAAARELHQGTWRWSFHMLSGASEFQAGLVVLGAAAAGCLLLGAGTRVATVVCWALLLSAHIRNPYVLNSGDLLLRGMIFWASFAPWGRVWSVDAWLAGRWASGRSTPPGPAAGRRAGSGRKQSRRASTVNTAAPHTGRLAGLPRGPRVLCAGGVALLIQLTIMYLATSVTKWNPDWLSGQALRYALELNYASRESARYLLDFPRLLQGATYLVLGLEILGPLAVWSPWGTGRLRVLVAAGFAALHLGIHAIYFTGVFQWVCLASWLLFLPPSVWDRVAGQWAGPDRFRAVSGGDAPRGPAGAAAAGVASPSRWGAVWIGRSAVWLGRCAAAVIVSVCLGYVICGSLLSAVWIRAAQLGRQTQVSSDLPLSAVRPFLEGTETVAGKWFDMLGLQQQWPMFARPSARPDGWLRGEALLADDSRVDLLREAEPIPATDARRPDNHFHGNHLRYFVRRLAFPENQPLREAAARFLVAQWDAAEPARKVGRFRWVAYRELDREGNFRQEILWEWEVDPHFFSPAAFAPPF